MNPKQRLPLYEHDPIHAGTQFLQVTVKRLVVPEGYEYEGVQRYVKYEVVGTIGPVEQTRPFSAPKAKHTVPHRHEYNTVEEAEARGDEIENEYLRQGWQRYHHVFTELE